MKKRILFIIFLLLTIRIFSQISYNDLVINEIMHSPVDGEPEWIELYNNTDHNIDLKDFKFEDSGSSVVLTTTSLIIESKSFLVISDNNTLGTFYIYPFTILVKSIPSLNNSGDELKIRASDGTLIDSVAYSSSWGGKNGVSLERKNYLGDSNLISNWGSSVSTDKATPGKYNSLSPRDYDLSVDDIHVSGEFGFEDSSVVIRSSISNIGLKEASGFYVQLTDLTANLELLERKYDSLPPGNSVSVLVVYDSLKIGEHTINCSVNFYKDEVSMNDNKESVFTVHPKKYSYNNIVINEIMYQPDNDEPEWIEILNRGNKKVNLNSWYVYDSYNKVKLPDTSYYLQPGQFLILSDKENLRSHYDTIPSQILKLSLPSLNNTYDEIVLKDYHGNTIDSVKYEKTWGGSTGVTLERILPEGPSYNYENWDSSISKQGATPGTKNSITKKNYDLELHSCSYKEEYALLGDTITVLLEVVNRGIQTPEKFMLSVSNLDEFAVSMILYEREFNPIFISDTLSFQLELFGLRRGYNFLEFQIDFADDEFDENDNYSLEIYCVEININPGDILINELMFVPAGDEPEWIELYNTTDHQINLKGSSFCDQGNRNHFITEDCLVESKSYLVLTKSINDMYKYGQIDNLHETNLPSMNNDHDIICFTDSLNRAIDLIEYGNESGIEGRSLERVSLTEPTNNVTNWKFSESELGGTPAQINSISKQLFDLRVDSVSYRPTIPALGENLDLIVKIENVGITPIAPIINVELINDGLHQELYNEEQTVLNPDQKSSFLINNIAVINEPLILQIECICELDGNQKNNSKHISIFPSLKNIPLLMNEIMYQPENGEPEWIEFYNFSETTVNLKGMRISDISSGSEGIEIETNFRIAPGDYGVVSRSETITAYHEKPLNFVTCDFETLNNDIDGVVIRDFYINTIDSVTYGRSVSSIRGYSLERRSFNKFSYDSTNWVSSVDEEKSSPGRTNSVRMPDWDLVVESITYFPLKPMRGEDISVDVLIKNQGALNCANVRLVVGEIIDGAENELAEKLILMIEPDEELTVRFEDITELESKLNLFARVCVADDEEPNNNYKSKVICPGFGKGSVLITEFMSAPLQTENEWVEVYNNSDYSIDLSGWTISDVSPRIAPVIISETNLILNENEYLVLCKYPISAQNLLADGVIALCVDFPSLGNTEDGIVLYDSWNNAIDSVYYNSEWEIEKGISLERIDMNSTSTDKSNWFNSICISGCSPGVNNPVSELGSLPANSLIINEIMYEPDASNSEFIEIYNRENYNVELAGVSLWVGDDDLCLSPSVLSLPGNAFFILASDSSIFENYPWLDEENYLVRVCPSGFTLPNDGTTLTISDFGGALIDSVEYTETLHNSNVYSTRNKSLERISLSETNRTNSNWTTSVSAFGATPGKVNSVFTESISTELKLSISPNPFSPDSDGFEDFTIISYNLPNPIGRVRLRIYDSMGRQVREIFNNHLTGSSGEVIFDGLDESGRPLRIGMYIVLFEAIDSGTGYSEVIKEVVVVARKL